MMAVQPWMWCVLRSSGWLAAALARSAAIFRRVDILQTSPIIKQSKRGSAITCCPRWREQRR